MSDHCAQARPGAQEQITPGSRSAADEIDRLAAAYPAFRFSCQMTGRQGIRWVAERKNGLHPGLHTVITSDLAELRAALSDDLGQSREAALRALL